MHHGQPDSFVHLFLGYRTLKSLILQPDVNTISISKVLNSWSSSFPSALLLTWQFEVFCLLCSLVTKFALLVFCGWTQVFDKCDYLKRPSLLHGVSSRQWFWDSWAHRLHERDWGARIRASRCRVLGMRALLFLIVWLYPCSLFSTLSLGLHCSPMPSFRSLWMALLPAVQNWPLLSSCPL